MKSATALGVFAMTLGVFATTRWAIAITLEVFAIALGVFAITLEVFAIALGVFAIALGVFAMTRWAIAIALEVFAIALGVFATTRWAIAIPPWMGRFSPGEVQAVSHTYDKSTAPLKKVAPARKKHGAEPRNRERVLNEKFVADWGSRQAAKDAKIRAKEEMKGLLRRVNEATDAGVHAKAGPRWRWTSIAASTTMAANWSPRTPGSCIRLPWRVSWRPWRLGGSPLPSALSWRLSRQTAQPFRRCPSEPRVTAMSHELLVRHTSRLLKKALREKNRQDARTAK